MQRFRAFLASLFAATILACTGSKEASAEFDASKPPMVLQSIQSMLSGSLSQSTIDKIISDFAASKVGATTPYKSGVRFQGSEVEMSIQVRKEDVDLVELRFGGPGTLVKEIQAKIATLPLDVEP